EVRGELGLPTHASEVRVDLAMVPSEENLDLVADVDLGHVHHGSKVLPPAVEVAGIAAVGIAAAGNGPGAERAVEVSDESHLVSAGYRAERGDVGCALRWPETRHVPPV